MELLYTVLQLVIPLFMKMSLCNKLAWLAVSWKQ